MAAGRPSTAGSNLLSDRHQSKPFHMLSSREVEAGIGCSDSLFNTQGNETADIALQVVGGARAVGDETPHRLSVKTNRRSRA
jgi:hypothetical protein